MFANLKEQPADKILALMQMYREDPRDNKIDLGVGVYKNAEGVTPIMGAVKKAEQLWWQEEATKAYTGLAGDPAFSDAMIALVLGDAVPREAMCPPWPRRAARALCGRPLSSFRWPSLMRVFLSLIRHGPTI